MPLLLALLACAGPADTSEVADSPAEDPSPYIYEDTDTPVATADLATITDAVQAALDASVDLDAAPVFAAYDAVMVGEAGSCPAWYADADASYWYDQCTAETGATFSGYGYEVLYDHTDDGSGNLLTGRGLAASAVVRSADGHRLDASGTVYDIVADAGAEHTRYIVLQGAFDYDGPEADGTWLADGVGPDVTWGVYTNDAAPDGRYVWLDGGFSPLTGVDGMVAASFDQLAIWTADLGSPCPQEAAGTVSVRGADGAWYDVLFDGWDPETYTTPDPKTCDGCGVAYYRGEPLGDVCVDFARFRDEGGR